MKSITGAVLNINLNVAEVIIGIPPIAIQTRVNSIKHYLKLNIKPVQNDRYKEFLTNTYKEETRSPKTIHIKFKEIFKFLEWKKERYPTRFDNHDQAIVNGKVFSSFFALSAEASSYSKEMMNRYTEYIWKASLKNQFQLEGYPDSPNPSCDAIPIQTNTSRETEVLLMSMFYKNNLTTHMSWRWRKG